MQQITLEAKTRTQTGKGNNGRLRRTGSIPAVVYRKGQAAQSIELVEKTFRQILSSESARSALIQLKVESEESKEPRIAVIKAIQFHPVTGRAIHVDFHQILLTERIRVTVAIHFVGEPEGVKTEGGHLELQMRQVEVECLPTEIPQYIEVQVGALKINQSIHVSELKVPAGLKVTSDADAVVVKVVAPHVEAPPEAAAEAVTEPEVLTAKKKDGEAEAAGGEKTEKGEKKEEPKAKK